jgi:hypothetical protein
MPQQEVEECNCSIFGGFKFQILDFEIVIWDFPSFIEHVQRCAS